MSLFKIMVSSVVAIAVFFDPVQTLGLLDFTLNEYLGKWYQVGSLFPHGINPQIICERFEIKMRHDCHECFMEIYKKLPDGRDSPRDHGLGKVANSKIIVTYPLLGDTTYNFTVTSSEDGSELILYDPRYEQVTKVLSRTRSASMVTKEKLQMVAHRAGLDAFYVNPLNCRS